MADRFVQEERHLWIADLGRDVWSCLTFLPDSRASHPVWSPDNRRILFAAGAPANLHWKESSGAGTEQRIAQSPNRQWSTDWSRDGRFILYYELSPDTQRDIWILPINPDGTPETAKARPYFRTRSNESMGKFSPEPSPRWVAYRSDESGLNEIVIQAFPEPHGKWQVSTGGGDFPEWSPDGRELFYVSPDRRLMAVSLQFSGDSVQPSTPRELFRLPEDDTPASTYAVAPDGKRFLVRAATDQDSKLLEVIVNWPALLKSGK